MKQSVLILFLLAPPALFANEGDAYYRTPEMQRELQILSDNVIGHLHSSHDEAYYVAVNTIVKVSMQGLVTLTKVRLMNMCFTSHDIINAIEVNHSTVGIVQAANILSSAINYLSIVYSDLAYITTDIILQEIVTQSVN